MCKLSCFCFNMLLDLVEWWKWMASLLHLPSAFATSGMENLSTTANYKQLKCGHPRSDTARKIFLPLSVTAVPMLRQGSFHTSNTPFNSAAILEPVCSALNFLTSKRVLTNWKLSSMKWAVTDTYDWLDNDVHICVVKEKYWAVYIFCWTSSHVSWYNLGK